LTTVIVIIAEDHPGEDVDGEKENKEQTKCDE